MHSLAICKFPSFETRTQIFARKYIKHYFKPENALTCSCPFIDFRWNVECDGDHRHAQDEDHGGHDADDDAGLLQLDVLRGSDGVKDAQGINARITQPRLKPEKGEEKILLSSVNWVVKRAIVRFIREAIKMCVKLVKLLIRFFPWGECTVQKKVCELDAKECRAEGIL